MATLCNNFTRLHTPQLQFILEIYSNNNNIIKHDYTGFISFTPYCLYHFLAYTVIVIVHYSMPLLIQKVYFSNGGHVEGRIIQSIS